MMSHEPALQDSPRDAGVLLTGATGFLGRRLLDGLLRAGEAVTVIVRASDRAAGRRRIADVLASVGGAAPAGDDRVTVCPGALERPGLGLSEEDRERIVDSCGSFLHCGASVRFDLPLEAARAINVGGTSALLDLARLRARRHGLERFDHVSTAFVAGDRTGVVLEGDLDTAARHRNTYERTKFEAEHFLRANARDLPVTVFRPSIVLPAPGDDSQSPIDWAIRIYAAGLWRTCPGRPSVPIDLVPGDFVVEALLSLRARPASLSRTFHVTAGPDGDLTLGEAATIVHDLAPGRKPVRFVDPEFRLRFVDPILRWIPGRTGRIVRTGSYYVPYFTRNPHFDNSGLRELLAGSGIVVPGSGDVLRRALSGPHGRTAAAAEHPVGA